MTPCAAPRRSALFCPPAVCTVLPPGGLRSLRRAPLDKRGVIVQDLVDGGFVTVSRELGYMTLTEDGLDVLFN